MKKLIISLLLSLCLTTSAMAAPFVYFNWQGVKDDSTKVVLLGLPNSPIESDFIKVTNPKDPNDQQYYKADYDMSQIPDGSYSLTGKIKNMWDESEESAPFPFVKSKPGSLLHLDLSL